MASSSALMRQLGRTKNVAKRSTKKYLEGALYDNLFKDGGSEIIVRQQLNQFLKSSKRVFKWEVGETLRKLRNRKLYYPALKLSEAMEKRGMNKTVSDQAIHLDLIAKARGIPAAENYFIELPETSKNVLTYGALLNCYCKEMMTEKAEALVEKMKELNLPLSSMSYNSLMTLYMKTGQPEKVPGVIQEMKASGVALDSFSYNVWMRSRAAAGDISAVERVVEESKKDGQVDDWTTYSNLASIYADAGLNESAEKALKELEKKNVKRDVSAYQFLITLYARTGNLLEVHRVWRSLRLASPKTPNISYLNMMHALVNLKDLPGAEKCFKEWESTGSPYDIRLANVLIGAYAKEGMIEKAEELKQKAHRRGVEPNVKTLEIFLDYHLKKGDIKSAVKCAAKAVSTGRGNGEKWVPPSETVATLMEHFEKEKDVDGAEGFMEILKKAVDNVEEEVFESLIRTYAAAGRTSPSLRHRLKMEKVEVTDATKKLLDVICT